MLRRTCSAIAVAASLLSACVYAPEAAAPPPSPHAGMMQGAMTPELHAQHMAMMTAHAPKPEAPRNLSTTVSPEAVGFDSARLKKLDDYMAQVVADGRVAGMTTLLARHGQVVEFKTYGKASLETGAPITKDSIVRI